VDEHAQGFLQLSGAGVLHSISVLRKFGMRWSVGFQDLFKW
jgi:hypothetical protein